MSETITTTPSVNSTPGKTWSELIRCPECKVDQWATVEQGYEMPFPFYSHTCQHCGHVILESEWNRVDESGGELEAALVKIAELERDLSKALLQAKSYRADAINATDNLEGAAAYTAELEAKLAEANARADIWERNYKASEFTTTKALRERAEKAEAELEKYKREVADLRAQVDRVIEYGIADTEEEKGRRIAVEAERDKLKTALEKVEWVWRTNNGQTYCPWCFRLEKDGHAPLCARQSALSGEPSSPWRSIETAPKDGSAILLLSAAYDDAYLDQTIHHPAKVAMGYWWPEGSSWVPQGPHKEDEIYTLQQTGVWSSGGGWFQPDEVTHWMPLPNAALNPDAAKEGEK